MQVRYRFVGQRLSTAARALLLAACLAVVGAHPSASVSAQTARLPGDQIFPDTAKVFVSIPNPSKYREAWKKTELGRMFHDPLMDAFGTSLRQQIDERLTKTSVRLGLQLSDLDGVAGGEIAFAMLQPAPKTKFSIAVLADVTGRDAQVKELQEKVRQQLTQRNGQSKQETVEGYPLTVWTFPPTKENPATTTAIFCQHSNWFVASDHLPSLLGMLHRIDGQGNDVLAKLPAYRAVMAGCQNGAVKNPHLRWFLEPFGLSESIREADLERERGRDKLKVLKEQGFGAVQGLGGLLSLGGEQFDTTYDIYVYAPTDARVLAARMLSFPSQPALTMPDWATSQAAAFLMANWEMRPAFEASKTLVDALAGSEVFEDALRDIELDPNGLRVNIRKEFIAYLGTRVYMLTQHSKPVTPQSEQRLMAFELTDPARVDATLNRAMPRDPNVKQRKFGTHVVWEIIRKENVQQGAPQGGFQGFRPNKTDPAAAPQGRPLFKNGAMAVAHGYLFYASDVEYLGNFITKAGTQQNLTNDPEFQLVETSIRKLSPQGGESLRYFARTDQTIETDYELFRQGKMAENESLIGQLLNFFLAPDEEGLKRKQQIDGSSLPPFAQVRQYFQPAGLKLVNTKDGWHIVGGLLARDQRRAARH